VPASAEAIRSALSPDWTSRDEHLDANQDSHDPTDQTKSKIPRRHAPRQRMAMREQATAPSVPGGRPLRRAIQHQLESPLAQRILAGQFKPGDTIWSAPRLGGLRSMG
jgi:hypothetical protein